MPPEGLIEALLSPNASEAFGPEAEEKLQQSLAELKQEIHQALGL